MKTISDIIWNDENENEKDVLAMNINCLTVNCSSGQPKKEPNVAAGYWCLRVPVQNYVPGINCEDYT